MMNIIRSKLRVLIAVPVLMACLLLGFAAPAMAATSLALGDIAIIGFDTDGDDDFAFVLLKDIEAGTSIYITDKGWNDGTGFYTVMGDGIWQWSTSADLDRGTVVYVKTTNSGIIEAGSLYTDRGTIVWIEDNSTAFSYMGDQLFFYQGTHTDPILLAGAHSNLEAGTTAANWDGAATSAMTSALPDQLTNGSTAIWLYGPGPVERDNFKYNESLTEGTPSQLRAAIYNISNWDVDDTNENTYFIDDISPFTVTIINTPPTLIHNAGITVNEGSSSNTITQSMLQVTDLEQTAGNLTYTITAMPANGTLYKNTTALSLAGTHTFTQADIDSNILTYSHNGSETTADSVKFMVSDGDGGSISETTFAIAITPVNDQPLATGVQLSGTTVYGQTLTGTYTYSDAENDPQGTSTYKWYRADSATGTNQAEISGAVQTTHILVQSDIGKYLCFAVTPVAQTGATPGVTVTSGWSAAVEKADCATATGITPVTDSKSTNSITLTDVAGYEYIRVAQNAEVNTGTWQDDVLFDGLTSGTTYDFYQRVKATATHNASEISPKLTETTLAVPSITTATLPNGVTEQAYSQTLSSTGTTPITWTISIGSLPTGLSLSGNTISGTPSATGTFEFTVKAENVAGDDTQPFSIIITAVPVITTTSLPDGITGQYYSQTLSATGSTPITWSIASGSLPTGFSLSENTISGTPSATGTYDFTVKAENTAGNDTQALSVAVSDPSYTATIAPETKVFPAATEGYGTQSACEFTISNTGTGTLTNLSAQITAGSSAFIISTTLSSSSIAAEGTATLSVRPQTNLSAGPYTGTLAVTGDNGISLTVSLSFTVNEEPTYTIGASPDPVMFDSLAEGYLPVEAKQVTITNTGNQTITLSQLTAIQYILGALSATELLPGETSVFTIAPKDGYAAGNWDETIQIQGSHGASAQIAAEFTCTEPIRYTILSGNNAAYHLGSSIVVTITSNGEFAKFSGLKCDGTLIDGGNYDLAEGSTIVTLHRDYLETLQAGSHTLRFQYTDGYAQTNLTIYSDMPATGDRHSVLLLILLAIACGGAVFALIGKKQLRK